MQRCLALCLCLLLCQLASACASGAKAAASLRGAPQGAALPANTLPAGAGQAALSGLPPLLSLPTPSRSASNTDVELLSTAPLSDSGAPTAVYSAGSESLSPPELSPGPSLASPA